MYTLVLIRHGESTWNQENRFTGWADVDLTEKGAAQATAAGLALRHAGYSFDIAYTSVLKRCIRSQWLIFDAMNLMWVPVVLDWRLNERHYGNLTGLNKAETAERHGIEKVHAWRRSYVTRPPPQDVLDPHAGFADPRYAALGRQQIPSGESLQDTVVRVVPMWQDTIAPAILAGQRVVINAHGNSMRALMKHLDRISDEAIVDLHIPNGIPIVYELDEELKPVRRYELPVPS